LRIRRAGSVRIITRALCQEMLRKCSNWLISHFGTNSQISYSCKVKCVFDENESLLTDWLVGTGNSVVRPLQTGTARLTSMKIYYIISHLSSPSLSLGSSLQVITTVLDWRDVSDYPLHILRTLILSSHTTTVFSFHIPLLMIHLQLDPATSLRNIHLIINPYHSIIHHNNPHTHSQASQLTHFSHPNSTLFPRSEEPS
jgi:hypothetical protein